MKITLLSIAMITGVAVLWGGAIFASENSMVSEAASVQQEEGKSEVQPTMSDMQPAQPASTDTIQEPGQAQPEIPVPSQDQAPSGGDQPAK